MLNPVYSNIGFVFNDFVFWRTDMVKKYLLVMLLFACMVVTFSSLIFYFHVNELSDLTNSVGLLGGSILTITLLYFVKEYEIITMKGSYYVKSIFISLRVAILLVSIILIGVSVLHLSDFAGARILLINFVAFVVSLFVLIKSISFIRFDLKFI